MRLKILLIAMGLSLFLGTPPVTAALLVQNGEKVAFLGDSITKYGTDQPGGYVQLVAAGLETLGAKIVPIPAGNVGDSSRDMLSRLANDVINKKPDWMTLSCGVNDVMHGAGGVDLDDYKKNITAIVDQCQAAGIKVLIMTATVIGEDLNNDNNKKLVAYNDFLRQFAKDRNLPLADENAAFQDAIKHPPATYTHGNVLNGDGVHPFSYGYQIMAKALLAGFGATPEQITQAEQGWLVTPGTANVAETMAFQVTGSLTLGQYQALQVAAFKNNESVEELGNVILMRSILDVGKAHGSDATPPGWQTVMDDVQKTYQANIEALARH